MKNQTKLLMIGFSLALTTSISLQSSAVVPVETTTDCSVASTDLCVTTVAAGGTTIKYYGKAKEVKAE